jgi:hypothetical protein
VSKTCCLKPSWPAAMKNVYTARIDTIDVSTCKHRGSFRLKMAYSGYLLTWILILKFAYGLWPYRLNISSKERSTWLCISMPFLDVECWHRYLWFWRIRNKNFMLFILYVINTVYILIFSILSNKCTSNTTHMT